MPNLNEYLGGIFNSITRARAMADTQTVQIAEQYAQHELLRHFSVPRMRFSDIELTIPVAVDGLAASTSLELAPIGNDAFRALVYREATAIIPVKSIPSTISQPLSARIVQRTEELAKGIQSGAREQAFEVFAKYTTNDVSDIVSASGIADAMRIDYGALFDRLARILPEVVAGVEQKQNIDQLAVVAESYRLREQRPEDLIYIKMTVSEDGMEWQTIDRGDGSVERKLLPE